MENKTGGSSERLGYPSLFTQGKCALNAISSAGDDSTCKSTAFTYEIEVLEAGTLSNSITSNLQGRGGFIFQAHEKALVKTV